MPKSAWIFAICLGLSLAIISHNYDPAIGAHDFIRYWSASRLLITGGNPYDANSLLNLQKASFPKLRFDDQDVVEAWNPPWLLLIMPPLGILPFELSVRLWILLSIFFLVIALFLTWRMAVGFNYRSLFPFILCAGFLFANTLEMIVLGQVSSLVLISLIFSVIFIQKEKDYLSGLFLFLTTIKPHLVYLFLLVIFVWSIQKKRWKICGGMALTGFSSSLLAWLIFPDWPEAYVKKLFQMPYLEIYCSTIGSFVAAIAGINHFRYIGVLLLPLAFPLARLISKNGWLTAMNLSLTLSIPLSSYGFSNDHVLLLPAVIEMIAWIIKKDLPILIIRMIGGALIITYGVLLWMHTTRDFKYIYFSLIGLALFTIYFAAWRYRCERFRNT